MSTTIDTKVLEMRFDNSQFEKNVQTSLNSIQKLKQSLNMTDSAKQFEALNNSVKGIQLSNISGALTSLSERFSTFGIVGMTVIQRLTNAAIDLGKTIASKVTGVFTSAIHQMETGGRNRAMNIENARFQLQGLLGTEKEVQDIMDNAMESVKGTAYGYDEAAKAASMFAATGLRAGEQMQSSLNAIAGVTAMTSGEYSAIAQIFTTVAGQGRLMADQLNQLAVRGLNGAATLKDFFNGVNDGSIQASANVTAAIKELTGGLAITEADLRDFVSKGGVSFEMFSEAMSNAFGEHAKKANDTFTGSLSNMKAALSRIGALFYTPVFTQKGPTVKFFNTLTEKIDEAKKAIEPLAESFGKLWDKAVTALGNFVHNFDLSFLYRGFDVVKNIFDTLTDTIEAVMQGSPLFGPVQAAMEGVADAAAKASKSGIVQMFHELAGTAKEATGAVEDTGESLGDLTEAEAQAAVDIWLKGTYGVGEARRKALEEAGLDYDRVQGMVNQIAWGYMTCEEVLASTGETGKEAMGEVSDATEEATSAAEKHEKRVRTIRNFVAGISNIVSSIKNILTGGFNVVTSIVNAVFGAKKEGKDVKVDVEKISEKFLEITERIKTFTEKMTLSDEKAKSLKKSLEPIQGIFGSIKSKAEEAVKVIKSVFGLNNEKQNQNGYVSTAQLYDPIVEKAEKIRSIFEGIQSVISTITEIAGHLWETISNIFSPKKQDGDQELNGYEDRLTSISGVAGLLLDNLAKVGEWFTNIKQKLDENQSITKFFESFDAVVSSLKETCHRLYTEIGDYLNPKLEKLKEALDPIVSAIGEDISQGFSDFVQIITDIPNNKESILKGIGDAIGKIAEKLKELPGKAIEHLTQIKDAIFGIGDKEVDTEAVSANMGTALQTIINSISTTLGNITFEDLLNTAKTGTIAWFLYKLGSMISNFGSATKDVRGITSSVNSLLDTICGTLETYQKKLKADALLATALAIAALTGSLIALASIPDQDKLMSSAAALALTGVVLGFVVEAFAKFRDAKKFAPPAPEVKKDIVDPMQTMADGVNGFLDSFKDTIDQFLGRVGMGVMLISFAATLGLVLLAFKSLLNIVKTSTTDEIISALSILGTLAIGIALFASAMSNHAKDFTAKQAFGIMEVAAALGVLTLAVKALGKMDRNQLIQGGAAIAVLMLALGAFANFISKEELSGGRLAAVGGGLIALAVGLTAMAIPIAAIGIIPLPQLAKGVGAIAVQLLVLSQAMKAMDDVDVDAVGIAALGVSLALMSHGISELSTIGWEGLAVGLIAFGGGLALVVGAAAIIHFLHLETAMTALAIGIGGVGAACLAIGGGVLLFGEGIKLTAENLKELVQSIIDSCALVNEEGNKEELQEGLTTVIELGAKAVKETGPTVIDAIVDFILGLSLSLANNIGKLATVAALSIISFFEGIATTLADNADIMFDAIHNIANSARYIVMLALLELGEEGVGFVVDCICAIAEAIGGPFGGLISGAVQDLAGRLSWDEWKATLQETYESGKRDTRSAMAEVMAGMEEEGVAGANRTMQSTAQTIRDGTPEVEGAVSEAASGMNESMGALDLAGITEDQLRSVLETFGINIPEAVNLSGMSAEEMSSYFEESLGIDSSMLSEMLGLPTTITDNKGAAVSAAGEVAGEVSEEFSGIVDDLEESGADGVAGYAKGLNSKVSEVDDAITTLVDDKTIKAMKNKLRSHSPAKETEDIGKDTGQGYVNGIKSKTEDADNAATGIAGAAVNGLESKKKDFENSGTTSANAYVNKIKQVDATPAGKELSGEAANGTTQNHSRFGSQGNSDGSSYASGVSSQSGNARNAGSNLSYSASNGAGSANGQFYNQGYYAGQGYVNGISAWQYAAEVTGHNLAAGALNAIARAQQSRSPAKKFIRQGEYGGMGYVIGLTEYADAASNAGSDLAMGSLNAMQDALKGVSDAIANDLDVDPTIRPVLDLSGIQNGIGKASDMINGISGKVFATSADAANATARSMNYATEQRRQSEVIDDDRFDRLLDILESFASGDDTQEDRPINNTFNIHGSNPREIADEVARIIQRQVERREASWA